MRDDIEGFLDLYESNDYMVFDTETTLIDKDKSVYAYPPEFILGVVYNRFLTSVPDESRYEAYIHPLTFNRYFTSGSLRKFITVGHNLTFDLLIIWINNPAKLDGFYWDTAIAEYEMYAQHALYPSLQSLADKYCPGEYKESSVSEMIKSGVCPKDIPKDLLEEYCKQDVNLTNKIFIAQMEQFKLYPRNLQSLILQRMKYRMITHEMSCNGMMMDREMIQNADANLGLVESTQEVILKSKMQPHMIMADFDDINPSSNQQIAGVLYGVGTYKTTHVETTGEVYKSGPKKGFAKTRQVIQAHGYSHCLYGKTAKGDVDTSEETLKRIIKSGCSPLCKDFVENLLEYRSISKERRTYFKGYSEIARDGDPYISIHTEFKHSSTPTGRISSAKPNIQNLKSD